MQKEMFVLLASMASKEELIQRMEEAISEYKEAKLLNKEQDVEEAYKNVIVSAHMFIVNHDTGGEFKGAIDLIQKMRKHEKREKLFDTSDIKN